MALNKRNYGLDLARCIAVLMVVIIHCIQNIFDWSIPFLWYGGHAGVELFFSLSGFLIGGILIDQFNSNKIGFGSIVTFLSRRWFRTLPLFYILYFVYLFLYNRFLYAVPFNWKHLIFVHNFVEPPPHFFGESWSLSIEEWSYLLIPLVIAGVCFIWKLLGPVTFNANNALMAGICLVIVGEFIFRLLYSNGYQRVYNLVLFRMDAVLYGIAGACMVRNKRFYPFLKAPRLIVIGMALWICAAIIKMKYLPATTIAQLYFPVVGCGTAIFVVGLSVYKFSRSHTMVTYISKISYSMYLLHLSGIIIPLLYYFKHRDKNTSLLLVLVSMILIIALSSATYYCIEKPFLRIRDKWFPR